VDKLKKAMLRAQREQEARPEPEPLPPLFPDEFLGASEPGPAEERSALEPEPPIEPPELRRVEPGPSYPRPRPLARPPLPCSALRALGLELSERAGRGGPRALLVTSPSGGEGKTFTAVGLALGLADQGDRPVVLVEADFRGSRLLSHFGRATPAPGLSEHVEGRAALPEVLLPVASSLLTVLPAGRPGSPPAWAGGLGAALAELRRLHPESLVVVDGPSLLGNEGALALSWPVDAVLLVVAAGTTRETELRRAVELLDAAPVLGLVYNDRPGRN
jgi:Mrp family chromosome partitioning ATPase